MKTKQVSKTVYVCDNCGATHSHKYDIMNCAITGKEFCDKCGVNVRVAQTDIYDDVDGIRAGDIGSTIIRVHPDAIKACELDLELDWAEYSNRVYHAMLCYLDIIKKIHTEYLKGTIRDFKVKEFYKTYFGN